MEALFDNEGHSRNVKLKFMHMIIKQVRSAVFEFDTETTPGVGVGSIGAIVLYNCSQRDPMNLKMAVHDWSMTVHDGE